MLARKILKRQSEQQPLLYREETSFYDRISQTTVSTDNTDDSHFEKKQSRFGKFNKKRLERVYWMDSSPYVKWWDLFDVFINVSFVFSYVVLTLLSVGEAGRMV
jgi:hypothetical protein